MQQQGFGQRLGKHRVGTIHEHGGLAEALVRPQNIDDLFVTLAGGKSQLDLPQNDHIKTARCITFLEQHFPFLQTFFAALGRNAGNLFGRQFEEQGQTRQDQGNVRGIVAARSHGCAMGLTRTGMAGSRGARGAGHFVGVEHSMNHGMCSNAGMSVGVSALERMDG